MDRRERVKLYDQVAEQYDRTRPAYPEEVIDEILGSSAGDLSVLDVGCGTGIAARQLQNRGASVLGVDMSPGMSKIAAEHGITTEVMPFETWESQGRTFDRVTSGQSWHWMDAVDCATRADAVLKPGGRLCLFWNLGFHSDDLADALAAAYRRALPPDSPKLTIGYAVSRSTALPSDLSAPADFGVVTGSPHAFRHMTEEPFRAFPWQQDYTRDEWLDELCSHTDHVALDARVRQNLFDEIGTTIDNFGGSFTMTFITYLVCATASERS
ncbi:class I SAM-dependent methyltransferase [Streptomyces coeruleorubidus]|uniref:class I SAM-dependent methyltransferase n=1 Tax=Streptomyces coeruleorubidus TaxID=116188 RepID=UPI0033C145A6